MEQSQADIQKIDNEGEYILQSIREGLQPQDLLDKIQSYSEKNKQLCASLISTLEFKNCYYIFKKLEKVLLQILKCMKPYDCKFFPAQSILLSLVEIPDYPEKTDLKPFMMAPIELYKQQYPEEDPKSYELLDYILRQIIICANNCGVIYMMRSKCQLALNHLIRASFARFQFVNDYNTIFQQAVLMINTAFCFKNLEKYEESGQLMNKGIIILEYIEKVLADHGSIYNNYLEKGTIMLTLLEFLFNKSETSFKECSPNDKDRITYLLSICYKYYGEVLQKQRRTKEAEFCFDNSKTLFKKFRQNTDKYKQQQSTVLQSNRTQQNRQPTTLQQQQQYQQPNQSQIRQQSNSNLTKNVLNKHFPKKAPSKTPSQYEDNFSHASFRTVNTVSTTNMTNLTNNSYVNKENIIFQKYVHLYETRYKIVIVQIKEFNCIQMLLYNKPQNILKKAILGFQSLLDYAQQMNVEPFKNQDSLNSFFKELIRKIKIVGGNLQFKDFQYYSTLEEYIKLNPNIVSNNNNKSENQSINNSARNSTLQSNRLKK